MEFVQLYVSHFLLVGRSQGFPPQGAPPPQSSGGRPGGGRRLFLASPRSKGGLAGFSEGQGLGRSQGPRGVNGVRGLQWGRVWKRDC